jgi:hypothetical protein
MKALQSEVSCLEFDVFFDQNERIYGGCVRPSACPSPSFISVNAERISMKFVLEIYTKRCRTNLILALSI